MDRLCTRITESARINGRHFIWRTLAASVILLASVAAGLGLVAMSGMGIPFEGNLHIAGIFAVIGALIAVVMVVLMRAMILGRLIGGLDRMDAVAGTSGQQGRRLALRLEFEQLEERLAGFLDERRDSVLGQERERLLAVSRYGWFMPQDQLERILDDETSATLKGKSKECVQVYLFVPGLSRMVLGREEDTGSGAQAASFLKKYLGKVQMLARSSGMMLGVFSLDVSVLLADVPFAGKQSVRKRLPGLCKKWLAQCVAVCEEAGLEGVTPVCLCTYDGISWARVQSGSRIGFMIEPGVLQSLSGCIRDQNAAGLWLSKSFCEHAAIHKDEVPNLVERASGEWYSLE